MGSGAQTLATLAATPGDNLAAIGGRHAAAKAMTALADQRAGLISALHPTSPSVFGRLVGCIEAACRPVNVANNSWDTDSFTSCSLEGEWPRRSFDSRLANTSLSGLRLTRTRKRRQSMASKRTKALSEHESHSESSLRSRLLRSLPLALLLALGALLWFGLGLGDYLTFATLQEHHDRLDGFVQAHYLTALLGFMLLYALNVAFSLPVGTLLTLAGGYLFGILPGAIAVVFAATLGAMAVYLAARTALGNFLKRRSGSAFDRLREGFRENAFSYLLVLRLIPLFPFWLVNLVPAFAGVRAGTFFWATLLGILPGTLVYASAGNGLGRILEAGDTPNFGLIFQPEIFGPLIGLALLSLLPVLYRRWKAQKQVGNDDEGQI